MNKNANVGSNVSNQNNMQSMDYSNARTIQSIQELQQLEKQLFTNLEKSSANSPNNLVEQEQIIKRINDLSATRIQLFNSLRNLYQDSQYNVNRLRKEVGDKIIVAKVMEQELNNLKTNYHTLKDDKNNKLRMVEINTYFGKRYQAHTSLMKMVIIICLILLVINIFAKRGFLPINISNLLTAIVLAVGAFYILKKVFDLMRRDNMNYDEYNWNIGFQPKGETVFEYNKTHLGKLVDNVSDAVSGFNIDGWNICGEGTIYDTSKNQCVVNVNLPSVDVNGNPLKESFCSMNLCSIQGYNPVDTFFGKV
jgi:hypothetical protein